jgi:hypothetical protein
MGGMDETVFDRHRCLDPHCGRLFAVVYRRSLEDVPIRMAVACPHCRTWGVVMLPTTTASREADAAWVVALGQQQSALAS